jgi:hypothetical protein
VVRHVRTTNIVQLSSLEGTSVQFRFADWFLRWGIMITVNREYRNFRMTIRPHRLVSADSAIFQACALGDGQAVARLIQEGKASPFDITSTGSTPLLVRTRALTQSFLYPIFFCFDNRCWESNLIFRLRSQPLGFVRVSASSFSNTAQIVRSHSTTTISSGTPHITTVSL